MIETAFKVGIKYFDTATEAAEYNFDHEVHMYNINGERMYGGKEKLHDNDCVMICIESEEGIKLLRDDNWNVMNTGLHFWSGTQFERVPKFVVDFIKKGY